MRGLIAVLAPATVFLPSPALAQRYSSADGTVGVALVQQPFSPTGTSKGPGTMATGGIQGQLAGLGFRLTLLDADF